MNNEVLENWEIEFENRRLLTLLRMYDNDVLSLLALMLEHNKERASEK